MKYTFVYRTSDNVQHEGVVSAASRDAAFSALKAKGIRPSRVEEAPGFLNKIVGHWLLIAACLFAIVGVAGSFIAGRFAGSDGEHDWELRAQIYGDPVVLREAVQNEWGGVFSDVGDQWLALHAVPGVECNCRDRQDLETVAGALMQGRRVRVVVNEDDLAEIAQMKRMVNGLKDEMNHYLDAGGSVEKYMTRLDRRQQAEASIVNRTRREMKKSSDLSEWKSANAKLRAMGLPMVEFD